MLVVIGTFLNAKRNCLTLRLKHFWKQILVGFLPYNKPKTYSGKCVWLGRMRGGKIVDQKIICGY